MNKDRSSYKTRITLWHVFFLSHVDGAGGGGWVDGWRWGGGGGGGGGGGAAGLSDKQHLFQWLYINVSV